MPGKAVFLVARSVLTLALILLLIDNGTAQVAAPRPIVLYTDPHFGPVCSGPLGPGLCQDVDRYLRIQARAQQITLTIVGGNSFTGPVCAGPVGPGPCAQVQWFIATQQVAQEDFQLRTLGTLPGVGEVCMGPFGQAPCQALQTYFMQAHIGIQPTQFDPSRVALSAGTAATAVPLCQIPVGNVPCNLVGQMSLDTLGGRVLPSVNSQGLSVPAEIIAQECAKRMGLDVGAFAACTGQKIVLPRPESEVLDCAVASKTADTFASCAAPKLGITLPDDQRQLIGCVMKARGQETEFVACAGDALVARIPSEVEHGMLSCGINANGDPAAFATCASDTVLTHLQSTVLGCAAAASDATAFATCAAPYAGIKLSDDQRILARCALQTTGDGGRFAGCAGSAFLGKALGANERAVLDCAASSADATAFATCAAPNMGIKLSDDAQNVARCAIQSKGDAESFAGCAGTAFIAKNLGTNERAMLGCATSSGGDTGKFGGCAANVLLGGKLSREQQVAVQCAAQSQGDPTGFATCAGANMFNMQLNPEQQIAVQCVVGTGGQPYAAAGCIGSRLTIRELTKCFTDGFGGRGCFGDSNDLVGRNGWVARTLGQVAGGPNSVINNPSQIWGGDNSFVRNPSQIWGGSNSFVRNPSQIWGGPNSIFNNPSQLLPQPRPLQIGSIGGKRICLPWC